MFDKGKFLSSHVCSWYQLRRDNSWILVILLRVHFIKIGSHFSDQDGSLIGSAPRPVYTDISGVTFLIVLTNGEPRHTGCLGLVFEENYLHPYSGILIRRVWVLLLFIITLQ